MEEAEVPSTTVKRPVAEDVAISDAEDDDEDGLGNKSLKSKSSSGSLDDYDVLSLGGDGPPPTTT